MTKRFHFLISHILYRWGNEVEWNGEWSDRSSKWNSLSDEHRRDLGVVTDADGEFW